MPGYRLDEIGKRFSTDKSSLHHDYLRFYERRMQQFETKKVVLLELGVYKGASLKTWGEFFPTGLIIGVDTDDDCKTYESGNIHVRIGDQSDVSFLFSLIEEFGRPDIVIDDASHRWDHQIDSFRILFPLLKPGGLYIIEDIDTSFDAHLKNAPFDGFASISAFDYLAKMTRCVVGDAALGSEKPYDLFIASQFRRVSSIEMARRTCLIGKSTGEGLGPW